MRTKATHAAKGSRRSERASPRALIGEGPPMPWRGLRGVVRLVGLMQDCSNLPLAPLGNQPREMGGAWRYARPRLDKIDNVEAEAAREIRPSVVVGNELHADERAQQRAPPLAMLLELGQEAGAIVNNPTVLLRSEADKSFGDTRRDENGILGIEPVVRVRHSMRVAAFVHWGLSANLEKRNAGRRVYVAISPAHQPLVIDLVDELFEPVVVANADAHEQIGVSHFLDIAETRLERFRVDGWRHDRLDRDQIAAD